MAKQVIFVLSGGCPGVITPHIAVVTREWVEVPDGGADSGEKRLVVGRAGSDAMPPEEVGRMGQIRKVAEATRRAMADAGLTDPKDVHLVMVKVPGLTTASIKDAESRGKTVVSHDLTFGPEGAGVYANDAAALGVAMALGEVSESFVGRRCAPQLGPVLRGGHDLLRRREAPWRGRALRQLGQLAKLTEDRTFGDRGISSTPRA